MSHAWYRAGTCSTALYVLVIMLQANQTGRKCDRGMNQLLQPNPGNPRGHSSVRARCLRPRTATSVQSWWAQGPPSARRLMMARRRRQVSPCRMARVPRRPGFRRTGAAHVLPGAGVHQARAGQGHTVASMQNPTCTVGAHMRVGQAGRQIMCPCCTSNRAMGFTQPAILNSHSTAWALSCHAPLTRQALERRVLQSTGHPNGT